MATLPKTALAHSYLSNNLLRALRPDDLALLEPHLHSWSGTVGDVLFEPGDIVECCYFPCGPTLISFVLVLENGTTVETALVGREGAAGGIVSHGRLPAYARAEIQFAGPVLRIASSDLERAQFASPTIRNLFARYSDCILAQVFQSVACNAAHSIEQRTVKWLLASIERTGDHEVPLTQEQLAAMMGVGRSYVSRVLQSLKRRGVLETGRGAIKIHDLGQLAKLSCACHDTLRRHFNAVLEGVYPTLDESTAQKDAYEIEAPAEQVK